MKRRSIIVVAFVVILLTALALHFFYFRLYNPQNIQSGYITRANKVYYLSEKQLSSILQDLQRSHMYTDSLYCGFEETFSITFLDSNEQPISRLFIALDGCPIFKVDGTQYYLEGKKKAREIIDEIRWNDD